MIRVIKGIQAFLPKFQFILLFLLSGGMVLGQAETPKRVLFVGNSYTFFWNLPQNVALLAENGKFEIQTHQSTIGGANWGQHVRGEKELKTMSLIQSGGFDAIVLQNHSMSAINRVDSMMYFGGIMNDLVKQNGAQTYLYMTWAREWNPYMQNEITKKYLELGKKIGAKVVPVGLAWQRARELRPGFPLYDEDKSHPSPLGTYLSACVFYQIFTGKSPVGLTGRLISEDKNGEKLYINIQSNENALFCQKVAEEILSEWKY